ncbi:MAG: 16S rRNA (guanine(527)-N(7))-methyltransferase RsmG [Alphaproteobacteria bacterium]|nr:16S rRNA (guanine(527)-N(7))-methyltransferase RsmG [Alphaproteobacteria bacterium]
MFAGVRQRPVPDPLTPDAFADAANVSRETLERLTLYSGLLRKWAQRVNLVGKSTLDDVWRRHMLDSAQLLTHIPAASQNLVDLGSGAGFPGMVLAIMGVPDVHLIESNAKKCAFLREVARLTGAPVTIHNVRIEAPPPLKADVVTARALAPMPLLFEYAQSYLGPNSICLFLKGRGVEEELTELRKIWNIRENRYRSVTDTEGFILRLEALSHDPAR